MARGLSCIKIKEHIMQININNYNKTNRILIRNKINNVKSSANDTYVVDNKGIVSKLQILMMLRKALLEQVKLSIVVA